MDNIIKLNNESQESKDNAIMRMMNDTTIYPMLRKQMSSLIEHQSNSIRPFIENIDTVNELYNKLY